MARRKGGRAAREGRSWWWLAVPLAGLAAYAGFDATLSLLTSDEAPPPSTPVAARPIAPPPLEPSSAAPPAADAPLAEVGAGDAAPQPSVTPAEARAAAAPAKAKPPVKKRAAPREDLTEQDRRALEQVLERATEQNDSR